MDIFKRFTSGVNRAHTVEPNPDDNTEFIDKYKPAIEQLADKLLKEISHAGYLTLDGMVACNDKKNEKWTGFSDKGDYTVLIWHWQSLDMEDDEASAKIDEVENFFNSLIKKYERDAKKIHPNCTIKLWRDDLDLFYIDFRYEWLK